MLTENRKELFRIAAAFLLLCAISVYRQISLRLYPGGQARLIPVYIVYVLLLILWWGAVRSRVVRGNMRAFIMAEQILMLLSVTARLVLESLFSNNIFLLRVSGYLICLPMVLIPLFGLYASFGLGKSEEYRMNRNWYYLLVPAGILIFLMLTNENHHFVFRVLENEVTPNLSYHPNTGIFFIIGWALSFVAARILLIFRRSREAAGHTRARFLPFAFAVSILLSSAYHLLLSYTVDYELIEYMVLMFFLEAMVWESCILIGMVPVNTNYEEVFDRSTVAMQILDEDGVPYLKSSSAPALSAEVFTRLKKQSPFRTSKGKELNMHKVHGGYAVWQIDISKTLSVIDELEENTAKLERESELLSHELKIKSDEAAIREQNHIYNRLTDEVGGQLALLNKLLGMRERTDDKTALFWKICLISTYIKRRCNLRLIEQSDGAISNKELELCYNELTGCLCQMGVEAASHWDCAVSFTPEFAIFTLDAFEFILEYERFELRSVEIGFGADAVFSVGIYTAWNSPARPPARELQRMNKEGYQISALTDKNSYRVAISEGRG